MNATPSLELPTTGTAHATGSTTTPRRLVTDAPTRMFHGLFALSFAGAYLTAESERWRLLHTSLGYIFAGLFVFRLLYGLFGPRQARLSVLWHKLSAAPAWLRAWREGTAMSPGHGRQTQHLAMALVIALVLLLVPPLTLSGLASDQAWGGGWLGDALAELHESLGNALLLLVLAHVSLIAAWSVWRRQNLARPMWSGRLPGAGPSPVRHNRAWLAGLLLAAVMGFAAWQWWDAPSGRSLDAPTPSGASSAGGSRGWPHEDREDDD